MSLLSMRWMNFLRSHGVSEGRERARNEVDFQWKKHKDSRSSVPENKAGNSCPLGVHCWQSGCAGWQEAQPRALSQGQNAGGDRD